MHFSVQIRKYDTGPFGPLSDEEMLYLLYKKTPLSINVLLDFSDVLPFFFFFNNKIKHVFFVLYIYIVCIYKLICYVLKYISDVNICGTFFYSQQSPSLSEGFRTSHSSMT